MPFINAGSVRRRKALSRNGHRLTMIGRRDVAEKRAGYLHHRITLAELVDWAEIAMINGDFAGEEYEQIHTIISRLGLADVNNFTLTWEDCEAFLQQLGYEVHVEVMAVM